MDSLTQFVLGAAVSSACLGGKIGLRKAALLGGLLGTLPDLDVLQPFADPVDSFVFHRGWSHSLVVHVAATPLIGEALVRVFKSWKEHRWRVWMAVFLCLSTHALLDALTIYGTRLFWPLYPDPVGVGSVFIIDPVYSLPLLFIVLWAFIRGRWSDAFKTALSVVLVLTTGYLAWGIGAKTYMEARAERLFKQAGVEPQRILAQAAPFNTLLWKVIGLEEGRYHNLYLSVLDVQDTQPVYTHARHLELSSCLDDNLSFQKLDWFSHGFFRADRKGDRVSISDLRMGLTPGYTFSFTVAELEAETLREVAPVRGLLTRRAIAEGDWDWLKARTLGKSTIRPAEVAFIGATEPPVPEPAC